MQITPVDNEHNLFKIENVFSSDLVTKVMSTDWQNIPWQPQQGQESWPRRRLENTALPWINQWDQELVNAWPIIVQSIGLELQPYYGTGFWLDEPGFTCSMHTDGEMPGSLHLTWIGPGTAFYWYKDPSALRYQTPEQPNAGYIMINRPDSNGYRKLQWHAMLTPSDKFRITSYTWLIPK